MLYILFNICSIIEQRDEEEEKQWNAIIKAVLSLDFSDLIDLRRLFWAEDFPSLHEEKRANRFYFSRT